MLNQHLSILILLNKEIMIFVNYCFLERAFMNDISSWSYLFNQPINLSNFHLLASPDLSVELSCPVISGFLSFASHSLLDLFLLIIPRATLTMTGVENVPVHPSTKNVSHKRSSPVNADVQIASWALWKLLASAAHWVEAEKTMLACWAVAKIMDFNDGIDARTAALVVSPDWVNWAAVIFAFITVSNEPICNVMNNRITFYFTIVKLVKFVNSRVPEWMTSRWL